MSNGLRPLRWLAASALVWGAPGLAATDATVSISARVPTVCTADLSLSQSGMQRAGSRVTGRLEELCNSVDGYRLILSHPRGLHGARIELDGASVLISTDTTQTVLIDSNHPAYTKRQFALVIEKSEGIIPLAIYAEPKGMLF